jgi:hypothetical protein
MGTRCTVLIESDGTRISDATYTAQLYHHWDGNPEHMLGLFQQAYSAALRDALEDAGLGAQANRAAAFIVATHPHGFDIEPVEFEHGDLSFAYVVRMDAPRICDTPHGPPLWTVEVWSDDPRMTGASKIGEIKYTPKARPKASNPEIRRALRAVEAA